MMTLFEELIEDTKYDKKIVKSFKINNVLSPTIFSKEGEKFKMISDIRKKLIDVSNDFIESLGVDFFIHDIVLTGSLANYNWSNYSDIDIHIIIDFKEIDFKLELLKEFFDAKKNLWNLKRDVTIKKYEVEVYVQDLNEEHVSSGVYSILNNKWVVEPSPEDPKIDDRTILKKGEDFALKIDSIIEKSKNSNVDSDIESLQNKLKTFRQSGLTKNGEFSYENLTFKLLRRNGYIEKLFTLKNNVKNKKLSLSERYT
jgi:predicted nucleotidyltransferase